MAGCEGIIDGRNQEYMIVTTYLVISYRYWYTVPQPRAK
jgi:hypothetical protein